jgi:hypothetical protein
MGGSPPTGHHRAAPSNSSCSATVAISARATERSDASAVAVIGPTARGFPGPLWSPQLSQGRERFALLDALPARPPSLGDQRRQTHSQPRVTNAATIANPAAPTSSCCHRGRALTHDANWLARVRARRSRRLAQANSVAHTPMPRKMISQPGPGNGRRITPTTTMASPIIAIPTRQTVSPAGVDVDDGLRHVCSDRRVRWMPTVAHNAPCRNPRSIATGAAALVDH